MVSKLYSTTKFYKLQDEGKIAKTLNPRLKLKLDSKGFYLNKEHSNGEMYQERLNKNDKVYSRQEGVTKYSKELDKKRKSSHRKETPSQHNGKSQFYDRQAVSTDRNYQI